jgi:lycopene beta-cyclase
VIVLIAMKDFDFIITGAGCAGLSLACRMVLSKPHPTLPKGEGFLNKKILLIDSEQKNKNDRTWCFWEKENGFFEDAVCKRWNYIDVVNENKHLHINISPYQYKMIRGLDFYNRAQKIISSAKNITTINADVEKVFSVSDGVVVKANGEEFFGKRVFNSIQFSNQKQKGKHYLLQHFKGYFIKTSKPVFKTETATLMDFRIKQFDDTRFVYTMPFSETSALVEYTVFSPQILEPNEYETALKNYLKDVLKIDDYEITETEFGIVPMTNAKFDFNSSKNIYNIGIAGGQTKASSGYTFQFIQKQTARIVEDLIARKHPTFISKSKFNFYDSVLLNILSGNKYPGNEIFTTLFEKNNHQRVLRFLDNESTLMDDASIFKTLPVATFTKAAIQEFRELR